MAAIALADFSIAIVDCTEHPLTISRRLAGHDAELTSLAWSNDAKWLSTASADASIRVWDIGTAQLIDQFKTPSLPTSLAFR